MPALSVFPRSQHTFDAFEGLTLCGLVGSLQPFDFRVYTSPRSRGGVCNGDIPRIDEAIIRQHINLPNRDPRMLTTSMVVPAPTVLEEAKKQTRMEILNMFYNTFDNDIVNITHRPQGLYMIP